MPRPRLIVEESKAEGCSGQPSCVASFIFGIQRKVTPTCSHPPALEPHLILLSSLLPPCLHGMQALQSCAIHFNSFVFFLVKNLIFLKKKLRYQINPPKYQSYKFTYLFIYLFVYLFIYFKKYIYVSFSE